MRFRFLALIFLPFIFGSASAARADICDPLLMFCAHEAVSSNGGVWTVTVTLHRTNDDVGWFNVITPARSQFEVDLDHSFTVSVPSDGTLTYSLQGCWHNFPSSDNCNSWTQLSRPLGPTPASVQAVKGQVCGNYANAAIAAVQQEQQLGCGYNGGRWSTDYQAHYNACMGFDQGTIDNETNGRNQDLAACKAKQNTAASACQNYANAAINALHEEQQLGCGFSGPRWSADYQAHYNACIGFNQATRDNETNGRSQDIAACKVRLQQASTPTPPTPAPDTTNNGTPDTNANGGGNGGGGPMAEVTGDVDLYDKPGGKGKVIGMLQQGTQVPFGGCHADNWCKIPGQGWAWGDFISH